MMAMPLNALKKYGRSKRRPSRPTGTKTVPVHKMRTTTTTGFQTTKTRPAFHPQSQTDRDADGCQDAGEDLDDDNDGVADATDMTNFTGSALDWSSTLGTDNDGDGCKDDVEDPDDDNDAIEDWSNYFAITPNTTQTNSDTFLRGRLRPCPELTNNDQADTKDGVDATCPVTVTTDGNGDINLCLRCGQDGTECHMISKKLKWFSPLKRRFQ